MTTYKINGLQQWLPLQIKYLSSCSTMECGWITHMQRKQLGNTKKKNIKPIIIVSDGIQNSITRTQKQVLRQNKIQKQNNLQIQKKKKIKKDPCYALKSQKRDRNVTSNLIHHFIKYCKEEKIQIQIKKIINKFELEINYENFITIFTNKQQHYKTYITNKHLQNLWYNKNNLEMNSFCKLIRILTYYFLRNYCFLCILYASKLSTQSKNIHFKGRRDIINALKHGKF